MKEVLAIIRPNKIQVTKEVLAAAGYPSLTVTRVMGRGKQRGLLQETSVDLGGAADPGRVMEFIPKRLLSLAVDDANVQQVVGLIMVVNRTGQIGDGRIFVCPVEDAVRVRTGERGAAAII